MFNIEVTNIKPATYLNKNKYVGCDIRMKLILLLIVLLLLIIPVSANWDINYNYRTALNIDNTASGSVLTDYQILVNVSYQTGMQSNFGDLHFKNVSDNTTEPHWIEDKLTGSWATVWVNTTYIKSGWSNDTTWLYWDTITIDDNTDGDSTFEFFDDFGNIDNEWTRYENNPILSKNSTSGSWDYYFVNSPYIATYANGTAYQDGEGNYYMYYSGSGNADSRVFNEDRVGLALSTDLYNWTRADTVISGAGHVGLVLDFGAGGTFDDSDTQIGTIIYNNSEFHMWYIGNDNSASDNTAIGYANSTDGKNWTKCGSNPILDNGAGDDDEDLYAPNVIYDSDTNEWKLWYIGERLAGSPDFGVMYATAPASEPWNMTKYSADFVYKYDTTKNMWGPYVWKDSVNDYNMIFLNYDALPYVFHWSNSTDGINWNHQGVIFEEGASGQWDEKNLAWISQINVSGTWYSYYRGTNTSDEHQIGVATGSYRLPTPASETVDTDKWDLTLGSGGTISQSAGKLNVYSGTGATYASSNKSFSNISVTMNAVIDSTGNGYGEAGLGTWYLTAGDDYITILDGTNTNVDWYLRSRKAAGDHGTATQVTGDGNYHTFEMKTTASKIEWYIDDTLRHTETDTTYIPVINLPLIFGSKYGTATENSYLNQVYIRNYTLNEPDTISLGDTEIYTDSLHYNASSPYNITIESDGTLTSNRSIITVDDTNWTAYSTGTTYWQHTTTITPVGDTNFTISGDNLDNFTATNLTASTQYDLINSSGTIEQQTTDGEGTTTFEVNLIAGNYWISSAVVTGYAPTITLVSFYPTPLNTNYTGATVISYMVNSSESLNLSSLAFLYGLNYTIPAGGDMHNYIGTPPNDIAYEGIYRAPNRNTSPYLSWEFNDTITEGNVWQWGGGDNNSWWISKTPINATHTWINATGITQHILPSSFYIKKTAMYSAPKTGFEINRLQGIIIKMWNVEEIRNRNANYFANMYFDTSWESTLPTYPVEVGFCNFSYDPTVDDIDTSPDCTKFGEWSGDRWVNHSWVPGPNASYALPFVVNASQFTEPTPTDINYIWLRSNTISSKSFVLNATNYDPGITNITFAETETMWTYNELNGVTSPVAYTPSFFTTFVRNDEELLHHLYIADDTGAWGHSEIFNETIGVSSVPVSSISFEHVCLTLDTVCVNDTNMDSTYDDGTLKFNIHAPADPDGGPVDHNITLHYANNQTLAGIINNTLTTTGDEYVDISFDTTPYYSSSDYYTIRCVSVDDEGSTATKWLISDFTLDADGNQGWISNGAVNFWGFNDIPSLYTTISNNSLISYDAGDDIYTMHIPFYKSKYNDTFTFSETVHLKSLNDEDVSYFRFIGETIFDNANIHAWNTTSLTLAPITDTYRGYVYSSLMTTGGIDNSNFSYLGSDFYRQEGLNFIGTTTAYTINNTVFSHNAEGLIMENCANFTISNSTISDNVNVGIGIYFTNDTIVENNTISSNGGRGVSIYEGHNNLINYNTITNSGEHGIHMWSNSINNTCTGNDVTGSTTYDYYLSSSSTDNYIIDPASTIDKIRVTSTSSVNIENTDNVAFSEDSLNTSYAYLTNFSMYVSEVSQTFDITQHTITITPSTDEVRVWNVEWGETLKFNVSSDTVNNPTWFNITNTSWSSGIISIYINGTFLVNETADTNGLITYNYSDTYSEKWFEFQLVVVTPTVTPTPTATATPPPSGGSSSGTGTTGVGTSDEPLYNIDCRETGKIRNLQAGTETYYRTTKPDCTDIIKVTFTPTQNSPEQPILIEKLHNISRFVTTPAPGITYSNFNLYVGLFGYDSKTTNEKILFKVSKDWTSSNNVTPESVTLYIFDPSTTSWKSIPTTLSHTDTLYYIYESESGATYGRFAIVGTDKVSLNIIDIITEKIKDIIPSVDISESKFINNTKSIYDKLQKSISDISIKCTSLVDTLKESVLNLLPSSISFDTLYNIFDNENTNTYIMAILTIILIAAISYFYNYEHGLIAVILAIIAMILLTIVQDTALIKVMSVEVGNIIISTLTYTTLAFIISYTIGEKLK